MADGLNLVLGLVFVTSCSVLLTWADPNEYRLVRDLMKTYDKRIRPSPNHSDPLNVTFGLALVQIIDVDEKNQILTTNCWLNEIWTDYNLRWDPAKYGGIKVLRLPFNEVWRPDILLHNNADVSTFISSISSNLVVSNDGNVTWFSQSIFQSSCSINVRYFPFDAQNCSMHFASWSYDGFQLNLVLNTDKGDISNYIPNSEWELIDVKVERNVRIFSCCEEPYPDIQFYLVIKRRPLFYIFNMILPCILITLVALLGFYIPSDSGEKVTMGITTLLSMTVFMMLITDNMPPTSDVLPLIGIYYGMTIFIVSFATAMTVFTLNIHHKGNRGKAVPMCVKKICFEMLAKIFCMKVDTIDHYTANFVNSYSCKETFEAATNSYKELHGRKLSTQNFTPDCNGMPSGSANYIRFKVASEQETEQFNMEMKPTQQPFHVDMPFDTTSADTLQSNGAVPRTSDLRGSNPNSNNGSSSSQFNAPCISEPSFSRVLQKVYQTIEKNDIRLAEQDKRECIKLEWQQVAQITDRLLLTCFVCVTLTITGIVLFSSPATVKV